MAQGEFTKEEAKQTEEAFTEVFEALPKSKRPNYLGHANDIYLFLAACQRDPVGEEGMSDEKLSPEALYDNMEKLDFHLFGDDEIIPALDIAVLRPDATLREVTEAAREVEAIGAASICVASCNVAMAKSVTSRVCSVIGFPHGNMSPDVKFTEARAAMEDGAAELDVVINYGRFLDGRLTAVKEELRRILQYTVHTTGARQGDPGNVMWSTT